MNKRDIKNSELDAIGERLLKSARLSGEEIDSIVAAPGLFDAARARVADIQERPIRKSKWFGWKPAAAMAAAAAVLIVSLYFGSLSRTETAAEPYSQEVLRPALSIKSDPSKQDFTRVTADQSKRPEAPIARPTAVKAVYREEAQPVRPKRRVAPVKNESPFHALSFAGNVEDAVRGGHVVRVDMPRSALFALGVNLPLENDGKFVKTDVLMGSDGVPRAIRFVE